MCAQRNGDTEAVIHLMFLLELASTIQLQFKGLNVDMCRKC